MVKQSKGKTIRLCNVNLSGGEAIETKRFPFWAFEKPPPADRLGEDEKIPKIDRTHKKGFISAEIIPFKI